MQDRGRQCARLRRYRARTARKCNTCNGGTALERAGGIVTDDSLRSLLISHYLLETEEIMVINHTDCGLMHTNEQELRTRIQNRTGTAAIAPAFFFAFQNIEENVRHQLQKLHTHPWIPKEISVRGFVYDVSSGRLREIK
jgi:carbonic anhydrase